MHLHLNLDISLHRRLVLAVAVILGAEHSASADWYSGDPYPQATAWPQYTENFSDAAQELALTFDNFMWVPGAGGGIVDRVGGHFHTFGTVANQTSMNTAYWEIRTGMSHNVGGTLLYSGSGVVTNYATPFTQGGYPVQGVSVDVPNFALPAGNYWFGLALGTTNPNAIGWFVASTTGANGIGGPLGDDLSIYFQSVSNGSLVNWDYTESAIVNGPPLTGFDPSYFIGEVPEPGAIVLVGMATVLLGIPRRQSQSVCPF